MFSSIDEVIERFAKNNYIASRRIATVIYLAGALQKPVLVEGPAGVGKTDLGKVLAASLDHELIRLQCYEGLDEGKALYEWEYAKQLLYTQILKDKISEVLVGTQGLAQAVERIAAEDEVFFSERFMLPRPLLKAITSEKRVVLLIDEIDKADAEFEAFLLELLSDFQVTVPEIGTIKAKQIPLVILTSNNAREMSDALKRRCLHLYIDFPSKEQELETSGTAIRRKTKNPFDEVHHQPSSWARIRGDATLPRRAEPHNWVHERQSALNSADSGGGPNLSFCENLR